MQPYVLPPAEQWPNPGGLARQATQLLLKAHMTNTHPTQLLATWPSVRTGATTFAHEGLGIVLHIIAQETQDTHLHCAIVAAHLDLTAPHPLRQEVQQTVAGLRSGTI